VTACVGVCAAPVTVMENCFVCEVPPLDMVAVRLTAVLAVGYAALVTTPVVDTVPVTLLTQAIATLPPPQQHGRWAVTG